MKIRFNVNSEDYPMLSKLKESEQEETIQKIFKLGYNLYFPTINEEERNYNELFSKLESLKSEIKNDDLLNKLDSLELILNKLIGISSNSIKKGSLAENILEETITKRYGDIVYEKTAHIAHSGDAWLILPDGEKIMLESKNYTSTVNKDEVEKMRNDMITNNIHWAIFVSFNSNIQGTREMDLITFTHQNQRYYAIMVSNLSENMAKLDLAIEITRKLIKNFTNEKKFPWLVNDINSSLSELQKIIQQNYLLRDNFYNIEKEINQSLSSYHNKLRDYQWTLENKITEIINKIKQTMEQSQSNINELVDNIIQTSRNKKVFPLISRVIDLCINKNCVLKYSQQNLLCIYKNNLLIANIKIQIQKVIVNIVQNELTIVLINNQEKENYENLKILESFL